MRSRIDLNPLRAFDADHPGTRRVMEGAPKLLDQLDADDAAHFAAVRERLDGAGVAYEVDPTLVRGLDYYTRTVFEFTSDALGAQSGVGGGGRYDGLMEIIGGAADARHGLGGRRRADPALLAAAAGRAAAAGPLRRLRRAASTRAAAFRLAADARRAGHAARLELGGRSLKGQLKQADRAGARFVAILGEEGTSLKDMESGEQKTVEPDTVMHHIRREPCEAAARRTPTATPGAASCARATSTRPSASPAGCTAAATTAG